MPTFAMNVLRSAARVFIAACLMACGPAMGQTTSPEVSFEGLTKTDPDFLRALVLDELGTGKSDEVEAVEQALRNLLLFSQVSSSTSGGMVTFTVREYETVVPILRFGGIRDNFWFQVGGVESNLLGRRAQLGGFYRYYDRHSFHGFLSVPYLSNLKWGVGATLGRTATTEPALLSLRNLDVRVDRWEAILSVRRNLVIRPLKRTFVWVEFGGGYLGERYREDSRSPFDESFDKMLARIIVAGERLNYYSQYIDGMDNQVSVHFLATIGGGTFWQLLNVWRGYKRIGSGGNAAIRLRSGIASNSDSPFVPFVLDSYLTVRGSGNRVARGTAELTANLEYRQTAYDAGPIAVQWVGFLDTSAWRNGGSSLRSMFDSENLVTFAGLGGRFILKETYNFTLRVDYGVNLASPEVRGFVIGVGQYF